MQINRSKLVANLHWYHNASVIIQKNCKNVAFVSCLFGRTDALFH